jgi:hypothetical protein
MWGLLFESCAEAFGLTRRVRPLVFVLVLGIGVGLTLLSFAKGGPRGVLALGLVLAFVAWSAAHVLAARRALWRAARASADEAASGDPAEDMVQAPTVATLNALARAVREAKRGKHLEASYALRKVDRGRLRADEERLYDATRAMVSLGLGEMKRAALQAVAALPTTVADIDAELGRTIVAEAWRDPDWLRDIDEVWAAQGIVPGTRQPLPRLRAIVRLRIDAEAREALETWEAKALADEARAIGDEALAADLESRARPAAYR